MNNNSRNNYNHKNYSQITGDSGLTLSGFLILIAMALKTFSLVPTIYQISKDKYTKNISFVTPSFLLAAFGILFVVALTKKYLVACLLFTVGIVTNAILIVQKVRYDNRRHHHKKLDYMDKVKNYNKLVNEYGHEIEEFESDYLVQ